VLLPAALRWHAKPVEELMAAHGLGRIGRDVRRAFTEADLTLYADLPGLFPDVVETRQRRFLGPIAWEPPAPLPAWWDQVPEDRPAVYLTLGSSGDVGIADTAAEWLIEMGFTVLLATAGRCEAPHARDHLFAADFLPGSAAAARAELVVCNGGSPTATQALLAGRPVIGLSSNVDQFLNMRAVQDQGAGLGLRADRLTRQAFQRAVANVHEDYCFAEAAHALAAHGTRKDPVEVLDLAIAELLGGTA
jgi:UDP:flavonoid glycosyltransferase YjiC (YdhE family)